MRKFLKILFISILIFATSCDSSEILCSTGPVALTFEFVDKDSGENLYENGTFDQRKQVTITNLDENKVTSAYINNNSSNRLILLVGTASGTFKYAIKVENQNAIEVTVVTERKKSGQCTNTVKKSVEIKNAVFEESNTSEIYKILIDTKN